MAGHLRKHWKKYAFGTVAVGLAARYLTRKFRENLIIREYCYKAKEYGEQNTTVFARQKKVMVFLNPKANNMEAKIEFMKYAAPLLFLSGLDLTIVEVWPKSSYTNIAIPLSTRTRTLKSDYEGQIRTLMGYINPTTDAIIVAGGDGTLMEVVNGLMRRHDTHQTRSIPIGIVPVGKENHFYRNLSHRTATSPARRIGEATMDIIRGDAIPAHVMELQPESGRTIYALSSVQWGVFKEAYENRDSFRLFGKLRLFLSYVNTAFRKWPSDYLLHLWIPTKALAKDSQPPPPGKSLPNYQQHTFQSQGISFRNVSNALVPNSAQCISHPREESSKHEKSGTKTSQLASSTNTTITSLAKECPEWTHRQLDVVGFHLSLEQSESSEESLKLMVWRESTQKNEFIKQGWAKTTKKPSSQLPCQRFSSSEMVMQPCSHEESWLSVDGEPYEAMPVAIKTVPNCLRIFAKTVDRD